MTDLATLGAAAEWPDGAAAAAARDAKSVVGGRLADVAEWLSGAQGRFPPEPPRRPCLLVVGGVPDTVRAVAEQVAVRAVGVPVPDAAAVRLQDPTADALAAGRGAVDAEIDAGADLLIVSADGVGPRDEAAAGVLVCVLTGAEPVAVLPRGAAAVDSAAWIARAEHLRDERRRVCARRSDPDGLLTLLGEAAVVVAVGVVLQAVLRRVPIVLDGAGALAAALLCADTQSRCTRWWRVADTSPDPVAAHATRQLAQQPLLELSTGTGDGTAGLLTVPLLRAAALLAVAP